MSLESIAPDKPRTETFDLGDQPLTPEQQFYTDFAAAQAEFPVIPKNSKVEVKDKVTHKVIYTFMYADLTVIISHTRPSLAKYGIGFTQRFHKHETLGTGIETFLFHESGFVMNSGFVPFVIPPGLPMKEVAALFTYSKRISLTAALGVSADEDVDAAVDEAEAGNTTAKTSSKAPASVPNVTPKGVVAKTENPPLESNPSNSDIVTQDQLARLFAIAAEHKWNKEQLKYYLELKYNKQSTKDLTKKEYSDFVETVQSKTYQAACATMINNSMPDFS